MSIANLWRARTLGLIGTLSSRVCEVKLTGNHEFTVKQQKYKVSEALKQGEAKELFSM